MYGIRGKSGYSRTSHFRRGWRLLKALRNDKAPGANNLPAKLLKYGGNEVMKKIHDLLTIAWEKEWTPKEWRKALYSPSINRR
jgi:hypothetical protein